METQRTEKKHEEMSSFLPHMTPLQQKVIEIVIMIPKGKVVSYGQVALYAGLPRSAREVGWILSSTKAAIPWWRVINNSGTITISGTDRRERQRKLLEAEGVEISQDDHVSMEKYRFRPHDALLRKLHVSEAYIQTVIKKQDI